MRQSRWLISHIFAEARKTLIMRQTDGGGGGTTENDRLERAQKVNWEMCGAANAATETAENRESRAAGNKSAETGRRSRENRSREPEGNSNVLASTVTLSYAFGFYLFLKQLNYTRLQKLKTNFKAYLYALKSTLYWTLLRK